jgi:phosphatidylserine/phosphatidylglycerophosphate/cardiolipin synthase-like enzyme
MNRVDRDVYVQGQAVKSARDYFLNLFHSEHTGRPHFGKVTEHRAKRLSRELNVQRRYLAKQNLLETGITRKWAESETRTPPVTFLHDKIGKNQIYQSMISDRLAELVDGVKKSIIVETPFMVPTKRFYRVISSAIERGVHVRILTNSVRSCDRDDMLPAAGYDNHRKRLVQLGIELWEYQGPEAIHAKSAVIDGETVIIGSFNLDPRSANLNTEVALMVSDPGKASELRGYMDENLKNACEIDSRGWPKGYDTPYPETSRARIRAMRWRKFLAWLIEHQL